MNDIEIEKGKLEYLFLDIKWDQLLKTEETKGVEPVQISIAATDKNFQKVQIFSWRIAKHQKSGKTVEQVLFNIARIFQDYLCVIVWTKDIYEFLEKGMRKYKIPVKEHSVIILQEVYKIICCDEEIKLENALKNEEINYVTNRLMDSKYCVDYLYQIFCKFCKRYCEFSENTIQTMKYPNILKRLPLTEKNKERICEHFQVTYSISNETVFIRTAFSGWIVYLKGDRVVKLLHESSKLSKSQLCKKQKMKCTEGYHKQRLPSENFYEVVCYITKHDVGLMKRRSR